MIKKHLDPYEHYYNDEIDQAINQCVHNERHRQVMHYKLVDGLTYEEIAEKTLTVEGIKREYQLSSRQVINVVYKYERAVLGYLAKHHNK